MKQITTIITFLLVTLLFVFNVEAQELQVENQGDLKVGVVLSGGGAKGVAHVGVLRMVEEAGIRVDYIGGTSMGAIVAALYSIGYSVDELDSIIRVLDMSKLVQGEIPRRNITYFEKAFDSETFAAVPVKNWKIGLPQGLSNGQDVINEFNALTREYPGRQDFNKLPIPLVIMATNIETGESVEFHEGPLALVMRASSSFPSLFSPVEIDGKLLVDGGVVNNFPVQEVINMGADVIIGVSVEDGLYKRKDLTSMTAIIEQITSFKMVEKSNKQKELVDVYVKPDITGYSVMSFDKAPEIIELGEVEGFKHFNELLDVANRQNPSNKRIIEPLINPTTYNVTSVEVIGAHSYSDGYFTDRFPIKRMPGVITIDEIRVGVNTINGTRNFDFIGYNLVKEGDAYKMVLNVIEKPNNEYLKIGLHYDKLYAAGLMLKYSARNKYMKSSIFMVDLVVSDKPRANILLYKDNSTWPGFLLQSNFNQFGVDIPTSGLGDASEIVSGSVLTVRYQDWATRLMAQKTINEDFFVALGIEAKRLQFYSSSLKVRDESGNVIERPFVFDDSWNLNPVAEIYADTRDNASYPKSGLLFKSEFKVVIPQFQNNDFQENNLYVSSFAYVRIDYTFSFTDKLAWTNKLNSSTRIGSHNSAAMSYFFGGYNKHLLNNIYSFYGYPLFGIVNTDDGGFIKYATSFQYNIVPDIYLTAHANYLIAAKDGKQWYEYYVPQYTGYAISGGYNSKIGPIEMTAEYSPETGRFGFLFNLGFWF